MSCRDEVLAAFIRLERRHDRAVFSLGEVASEVQVATDEYAESTIRTHISSRMCSNAPDHHDTTYDDLERVDHGQYKLRRPPKNNG